MLTVRDLLADLDVRLLAGDAGLELPVRWVHISELDDPTPWLSGGEVLLTTGMQLGDTAGQREYVNRLADHQLAALGFGTGFGHDEVPPAIVEAAAERQFPVFEVPYEVPFIAVTEAAFTQLVNEQYAVLRRALAAQERLERIVLSERGLDALAGALATLIGAAILVFDPRGELLVQHAFRRPVDDETLATVAGQLRDRTRRRDARAFMPVPEDGGNGLALPVAADGPTRSGATSAAAGERMPEAWLVAVKDAGPLTDFDRLTLHQAVTIVALELLRARVAGDTERRLAGDILAAVVRGELAGTELGRRLEPFGLAEQVAAIVVERPGGRLCSELGTAVQVGVGRPVAGGDARRSFHEARCAAEALSLGVPDDDHGTNGSGEGSRASKQRVGTYRDLGSFQLLLSLQDDEALRLFCDSILGPIEASEGPYGGELMRSLEAFIEENGQWERAARRLYCHRHTLRYRIRRVEELTGRNLGSARDRIEFWLALRGRELVS
jgi:purine catabolism regulator